MLRSLCHWQINKLHARIKTKLFRQGIRLVHQLLSGFHARHYSPFRVLFQVEVVQNKPKIRLARTMIHQVQTTVIGFANLGNQRFNKLSQVVHLLQLPSAVLVNATFSRHDVQGLQQFD